MSDFKNKDSDHKKLPQLAKSSSILQIIHKNAAGKTELTHKYKGKVILINRQDKEQQNKQNALRRLTKVRVKNQKPSLIDLNIEPIYDAIDEYPKSFRFDGASSIMTTYPDADELDLEHIDLIKKINQGYYTSRNHNDSQQFSLPKIKNSVKQQLPELYNLKFLSPPLSHLKGEDFINSNSLSPLKSLKQSCDSCQKKKQQQLFNFNDNMKINQNMNSMNISNTNHRNSQLKVSVRNLIKSCLKMENQTPRELKMLNNAKDQTHNDFLEASEFAVFKQECWYDDRNFNSHKFNQIVDNNQSLKLQLLSPKFQLQAEQIPSQNATNYQASILNNKQKVNSVEIDLQSTNPIVKQCVKNMTEIDKQFECRRRIERCRVNYKSMHDFNLESLKDFKQHQSESAIKICKKYKYQIIGKFEI
eukprot:403332202